MYVVGFYDPRRLELEGVIGHSTSAERLQGFFPDVKPRLPTTVPISCSPHLIIFSFLTVPMTIVFLKHLGYVIYAGPPLSQVIAFSLKVCCS